ncbi:MAG: GGDEF domain-containing protein [Spirochaetia bacterium]|nr:GGDEF domain-containing protein [Spirochaetia bacterium]
MKFQIEHKFKKEFFLWDFQKTLLQGKIAYPVGLVCYVVLGIIDYWFLEPELTQTIWNWRLLFISFSTIAYIAGFFTFLKKYHKEFIAFIGINSGISIIVVSSYMHFEILPYYYPVLMLITFWTYNFSGTKFTYALIVDISIIILYNISEYNADLPLDHLLTHNFFLLSANLIGGSAGFMAERNRFSLFINENNLQHEKEKHLHSSLHDPLTDLPNRILLKDRLEEALQESIKKNYVSAFYFIDLDEFKPVNDNYGHQMGDCVLKEIAQRLRLHLREKDTISRISGDEFALIAVDIKNKENAETIAEKIMENIIHPVKCGSNQIHVGASIGILLFPDNNLTADEIWIKADKNMYKAKDAGKNQYSFSPAENA